MLKLYCQKCNEGFLTHKNNQLAIKCPKCEWKETRAENYNMFEFLNAEIKAMETRLQMFKDDGLIDEEAYQTGLLGISYLQKAAH